MSPAAGWYADPGVPGRLRWWDGTRWTEHVTADPAARTEEAGAQPRVAPGWYADPTGVVGQVRWWDGTAWTSQVAADPAHVTASASDPSQAAETEVGEVAPAEVPAAEEVEPEVPAAEEAEPKVPATEDIERDLPPGDDAAGTGEATASAADAPAVLDEPVEETRSEEPDVAVEDVPVAGEEVVEEAPVDEDPVPSVPDTSQEAVPAPEAGEEVPADTGSPGDAPTDDTAGADRLAGGDEDASVGPAGTGTDDPAALAREIAEALDAVDDAPDAGAPEAGAPGPSDHGVEHAPEPEPWSLSIPGSSRTSVDEAPPADEAPLTEETPLVDEPDDVEEALGTAGEDRPDTDRDLDDGAHPDGSELGVVAEDTTAAETDEVSPGWYPDPSGAPDQLRWWDGAGWTDSVTPDPEARDEHDADEQDADEQDVDDQVAADQPAQEPATAVADPADADVEAAATVAEGPRVAADDAEGDPAPLAPDDTDPIVVPVVPEDDAGAADDGGDADATAGDGEPVPATPDAASVPGPAIEDEVADEPAVEAKVPDGEVAVDGPAQRRRRARQEAPAGTSGRLSGRTIVLSVIGVVALGIVAASVTSTPTPDDPPTAPVDEPAPDVPSSLTVGDSFEATLPEGESFEIDLVVEDATEVTVDVRATSDWDPVAEVLDAEGVTVAYNDDRGETAVERVGGGYYDPLLVAELEPGTYRVIVRGFANEAGSFELRAS